MRRRSSIRGASRKPATRGPSGIHVGSHVAFKVGDRIVRGIVVEDRGITSRRGGRLVRIRVNVGDGQSIEFEIPSVSLTRAA